MINTTILKTDKEVRTATFWFALEISGTVHWYTNSNSINGGGFSDQLTGYRHIKPESPRLFIYLKSKHEGSYDVRFS
jgi:hypothetical protein